MKYVKIALGSIAALALIMGTIWILQGINILPGSFMTGDIRWAYRGAGLAVIGVVLLAWTTRTPGVGKRICSVIGVLFMLNGLIWILQGINVLPGSFMTGDIRWSYRGGMLAAVGLALLILSLRSYRSMTRK